MSFRRRWPWLIAGALGVLVVASGVLVAFFPARWAWHWLRADYPLVRVGQVSGSVWNGRAQGLRVRGQSLGMLHWTLGRAALWGNVMLHVDLGGAGVMVNGHIQRDGDGAIVVRDMRFDVPMVRLKVLWPTGMRLAGHVQGDVARATLVEGWPTQLDARVHWSDAAVTYAGKTLALGQWCSRWHAAGGTVVSAALSDDGRGLVGMHGTLTATLLGWRLDATLTPRRAVPGLDAWLARLGRRAADGSVHVERKGGLMAGRTWQ
ncbi:MAG TPA: type II secretion system protein N [Rhodanobacteraceae bacterium]